MKLRYRFTVYPSKYRASDLSQVLEATKDSLRLLMPTWQERLANFAVSTVIFFGFLAVVALFISILPLHGLSVFEAVVAATLSAVFFVAMFFFSGLGFRLGRNLELRLTARRSDRVLNVRVRQIRPGRTGGVQLVELSNGGKEDWFTVHATNTQLREALTLAGADMTSFP